MTEQTRSKLADVAANAWPIVVALVAAGSVLAFFHARILQSCGGELIYGLDDAYIHLTIARNLVEHGSWGINAGEFASTSSSLLWPALLAVVRATTGMGTSAPMWLSIVLVVVVLVRADRLLSRRSGLPAWGRVLVLLALFAFTPMPELVFNGMEHLLHVWLTIEFLDRVGRLLASTSGPDEGGPPARRDAIVLIALCVLLPAVRYEALFQVAALVAVLAWRRHWRLALVTTMAASLPVLAYGLWATSEGWPFIPSGLLLKTVVIEESAVEALRRLFNEFAAKVPGALPIVAAISFGLIHHASRSNSDDPAERADLDAMLVFALSAVAHLSLANLGNLFRYEAYLYAGALFVLAPPLWFVLGRLWRRIKSADHPRLRIALVALALALPGFTVFQRGAASTLVVPLTSRDIYQQQIQMARVLERSAPDAVVAINDIGAISYYTDTTILDIVGLASRDIASIHLADRDFSAEIGRVAREHDVAVAAVYEPWLGDPPADWRRAGEWTVPEKIVLGWPTVTFFSVSPEARGRLVDGLNEYDDELPRKVWRRIARRLSPLDVASDRGRVRRLQDHWVLGAAAQLSFQAPIDGKIAICASPGEEEARGTQIRVRGPDSEFAFTLDGDREWFDGEPFSAGEAVEIEYLADEMSTSQLIIWDIEFVPTSAEQGER